MTHPDVTPTILVVDDDALYLEKLCNRFREIANWNAFAAKDASECLEVLDLSKGKVDVALIDTTLPRGERDDVPHRHNNEYGVEVAKIIKKQFSSIRVFGMSVEASADSRAFWESRTEGFVPKSDLKASKFPAVLKKFYGTLQDPEVSEFRSNFNHGGGKGSAGERVTATINARMIETVLEKVESSGWTIQQWADYLNCSKSAVCETKIWRTKLSPEHKLIKAEKANDRRQNGRSLKD